MNDRRMPLDRSVTLKRIAIGTFVIVLAEGPTMTIGIEGGRIAALWRGDIDVISIGIDRPATSTDTLDAMQHHVDALSTLLQGLNAA